MQIEGNFGQGICSRIAYTTNRHLPKGTIRVRAKGSAGTHNGMRNIISELGSGDFHRIRIGIGPVPTNVPLVDYVLADVPKAERQTLFDAFSLAADEAVKLMEANKS